MNVVLIYSGRQNNVPYPQTHIFTPKVAMHSSPEAVTVIHGMTKETLHMCLKLRTLR